MDIDIKKNGKINLKDTPYYEPIDNTNISFSNMDIGTAMITFQIKKNGLPLQVSKKNVWVYAYLESKNGTRSEVTELNVIDPFEGKVALQLDKEFLVGATNSTVEGQLYITLHKFNDVPEEFSDTVALQKFTFTVQDALINTISGVTKTEYIRTFDQLKTEVKEKIEEMQENIGDIETLVERVNTAAKDAINKVNDAKDAMIKDMQSQYDETEADLTELRESSIQKLNLAATNYINDIKNAKDEVVQMIDDEHLITTQKFEEYKSDLDEEIQIKLQEYEDFINENKNDFEGIINELNWQKYKLTNEDGGRVRVSGINPTTLNAGFYQIWNTSGMPTGEDGSSSYWNVDVTFGADNTKQILAVLSGSGKAYLKNIHKNTDLGWKELTNNTNDTGWVTFDTINGVKSNTAFSATADNGFKCSYRILEENGVTRKMVRINITNVSHQTVIANMPENFAKNVQFHYVRALINRGYGLIGIFPSGNMYAYIESDKRDGWIADDYFYGQIEWTE